MKIATRYLLAAALAAAPAAAAQTTAPAPPQGHHGQHGAMHGRRGPGGPGGHEGHVGPIQHILQQRQQLYVLKKCRNAELQIEIQLMQIGPICRDVGEIIFYRTVLAKPELPFDPPEKNTALVDLEISIVNSL